MAIGKVMVWEKGSIIIMVEFEKYFITLTQWELSGDLQSAEFQGKYRVNLLPEYLPLCRIG